jgi:hypothetical protein
MVSSKETWHSYAGHLRPFDRCFAKLQARFGRTLRSYEVICCDILNHLPPVSLLGRKLPQSRTQQKIVLSSQHHRGSGIGSYHLKPSRLSKSQELRQAAADSDAALTQVRKDCQQRVSEVEEEMRGLLLAMERQKAKSAAKVQQLSAFLEDLKRSS